VDVLHHDLETVEELCFGALNFGRESLDEVLVDDTVRLARCKALAGYLKYSEEETTHGSKESKDVFDKVFFVLSHLVFPIVQVHGEVDFLGGPERRLGLFVHLPNLFR
jgi:hypothetical protein